MTHAVPAVFLGQPAGGAINLGPALRGFEGGLIGRLLPDGGPGGIATQMAPSDNPSGGGTGGVTTLRFPHD